MLQKILHNHNTIQYNKTNKTTMTTPKLRQKRGQKNRPLNMDQNLTMNQTLKTLLDKTEKI
jgi:hypothetical protein